eukprot:scaffold4233_cov142-Skeletonema_dohrnii-CCMP3373.AAC.18
MARAVTCHVPNFPPFLQKTSSIFLASQNTLASTSVPQVRPTATTAFKRVASSTDPARFISITSLL